MDYKRWCTHRPPVVIPLSWLINVSTALIFLPSLQLIASFRRCRRVYLQRLRLFAKLRNKRLHGQSNRIYDAILSARCNIRPPPLLISVANALRITSRMSNIVHVQHIAYIYIYVCVCVCMLAVRLANDDGHVCDISVISRTQTNDCALVLDSHEQNRYSRSFVFRRRRDCVSLIASVDLWWNVYYIIKIECMIILYRFMSTQTKSWICNWNFFRS